ncbi:MAG: Xaa-Pro aminopeptidase [Aliiglaciecola sp.]
MKDEFIAACVERRNELLGKMLPNSVAVVPAASLVTRSNDTEYPFRQNSDFHYLTHFPEPDAVLVLSNSEEFDGQLSALFCLDKDPQAEIWHGRRFGAEEAMKKFAFDTTHILDDLDIGLASYLDGHENLYHARGQHQATDELIDHVMQQLREAPKQSKIAPAVIIDLRPLLHEMRLFKTAQELSVMQRAADISSNAHTQAMQCCQPGHNEYHLEATIHHTFAMHGAKHPAYGTIVGGGNNACILHYTQNDALLNEGDLVLIDAGAELEGYAADITRTFPINGKFTHEQATIYQLVLDAQLASLQVFKPGNTFKMANDAAIEVLTQGLLELGLLEGELTDNIDKQTYRAFYMHGIGHWLGLDVHDVGNYKVDGEDRPFEPGMVMTVEPGLYISPDAKVNKKWRGIGVRIEDNIVITEYGHRVMTAGVVKTIDEIEQLMAQ